MARAHTSSKTNKSWGEGYVFKPDFHDMVHEANLIVLGKVVEVGTIERAGPSKKRSSSKKYTFWEDRYAILQIDQTYKGKKRSRVKIAFHSDLEGDKTEYRKGSEYLAFLIHPTKYPDAYTTAYFHFGQYRINEKGRAERVAVPTEISKPIPVVVEKIEAALHHSGS